MLIPKKNRKLIYETIFKEGVLVAKKDFNAPTHTEIEAVPNLQVIKAMQVSSDTHNPNRVTPAYKSCIQNPVLSRGMPVALVLYIVSK